VSLRKPTSLLLALAACVAVGCGADEETKPSIPGTAAGDFFKRLDSIEARFKVGDGACRDIPKDQLLVNDQIAKLPSSVDADVRNALQDSFDHLFDLTDEQCDEGKGEQTDTNTDTTPTTETQTTDTSTETETTDTNTDTTDTGSTDTTPPDTNTDVPPPGQGGEPPGQGGQNPGGGTQGPGL
jgi:hypothetical protein